MKPQLPAVAPAARPVTIRDVAERAGVSPTVVSFVLTGNRPVSAERRRRVEEAIAALGYTPNAAAQSLRLGQTRLVAVVIPYLSNPLYSAHAIGAEQELSRVGLLSIVCSTREGQHAPGEYFKALRRSRVDGLLLFPYQEDVPDVMRLAQTGTPVVFIDREPELPDSAPPVDAVVIDNERAVFDATEHLLALGHRRIGLVTLRTSSLSGPSRLAGFKRAFAARGLRVPEEYVRFGRGSVEEGYALTQALLQAQPPVTALVVTANMATLGAVQAAQAAGQRIPDDLSVVGYDFQGFVPWPSLDLTAVEYPSQEVGREAARLLLRRLRGEASAAAQRVVLRAALHVGTTTKARDAHDRRRETASPRGRGGA